MEHIHEDGCTPHTHTHDGHTHTHDGNSHTHSHTHTAAHNASDPEKVRALLHFMIEHNEHHTDELADLLDSLPSKARQKMIRAIGTFEAGNVQLRQVLDELE